MDFIYYTICQSHCALNSRKKAALRYFSALACDSTNKWREAWRENETVRALCIAVVHRQHQIFDPFCTAFNIIRVHIFDVCMFRFRLHVPASTNGILSSIDGNGQFWFFSAFVFFFSLARFAFVHFTARLQTIYTRMHLGKLKRIWNTRTWYRYEFAELCFVARWWNAIVSATPNCARLIYSLMLRDAAFCNIFFLRDSMF